MRLQNHDRLMSSAHRPRLVVFTGLFPSAAHPLAGVFVKERMFRVGRALPLAVVAPQPWFPGQSLVRRFRPGFRHALLSRHELMEGFEVFRPRYFSLPAVMKRFDGLFMAAGAYRAVSRLAREGRVDVIDAHWAYPGGRAAQLIARRLHVPMTVTLRGDEARRVRNPAFRRAIASTIRGASRVFAVSGALQTLAIELGALPAKVRIVGNGVDTEKFAPMNRMLARERLAIASDARVLITVGSLCERKGFHRVIDCLPALRAKHPSIHYIAVGGPGPEGDWTARLQAQAAELGLPDTVHFTGPLLPTDLRIWLSAADVFVLATRYEGWANVLLEAMACGLPVVTTDVGGNAEVVCHPHLGTVVPFDNHEALVEALDDAVGKAAAGCWDASAIRRYSEENGWQRRIDALVDEFRAVADSNGGLRSPGSASPHTAVRIINKS